MSGGLIVFREDVVPNDVPVVRSITESTGFFAAEEVDIAVELVEERLAKGLRSGYHFIFAEQDGVPVGYTSYGPIACTTESFDLFWIVVDARFRGKGLGTTLLERSEAAIAALGGSRVYVETSARPLYEPTRGFYLARGYRLIAEMEDFYAPGDAKDVFLKVLPRAAAGRAGGGASAGSGASA
jgi:GNAT superfamily N-acetyltransferase